jgi:phosphoglycolate phosphatase
MSTLQTSPENTLFVGDSAVDLQTASNAGVDCILVTYGFRTREELEQHYPQTLIDHPMNLLSILDSQM